MRYERNGSFEVYTLQEAVEDAQKAVDRAKARLVPLRDFAERMEAAGDAFIAEAKAAIGALPKGVGNEIIDKEMRRITEAVSNVENLLCVVGLDALRETEAEVMRPLEQALEAAEQALENAEREQADRDYFMGVL